MNYVIEALQWKLPRFPLPFNMFYMASQYWM